ncbi:serine hydrolase domain-containing protein [Ascidiimonas aurantiaca]|uniref:serine hydrolase domain-containing protein n=1 Tax=Ascidiimonas aurantiaca TaxID=1685432 RepID=UPI0030EE99A8
MQKLKSLILLISIVCISCSHKQDKNSNAKVQDNQIDSYLKECEANGFNGALLIVKNDNIILNKGYGLASKKDSIPNTPETVFDICSVTKQFTGAAIVKLEEEEKLKVTDTLGQYFKNIPSDKRGITIHQLLTHSAGFGHGIGVGDFDHMPQDVYFKELFDTELRFKPGTSYSYSNSGYSVLGRIIELVSGKNYEDYLKEKIFEPSGMKHTGYLLPEWDNKSIANEYLYNCSLP